MKMRNQCVTVFFAVLMFSSFSFGDATVEVKNFFQRFKDAFNANDVECVKKVGGEHKGQVLRRHGRWC